MPFDPLVSCFRRANDPDHVTNLPLSAVVARIRSDELSVPSAEIRRIFQESGGGDAGKKAICELKKPLPAITIAGTFERRANAAWNTPSCLVGIDLDGLDQAAMTQTWNTLTASPWVAMLFRSPSGSGLKGAVRVPEFTGTDREAYAAAWKAVSLWLTSLGLENDPAVKDVSRLAFLAHDSDAFLNLDVIPFDVAQWTPKVAIDPQPTENSGGLRPGDDFNRHGDLPALLTQHGWTYLRTATDGNQHWCRPGKTEGTSATIKDNVLFVFSSNAAPFESNTGYSPFAVLAYLEHSGDFAAASRSLRSFGYGDQERQVIPSLFANDSEEEEETSESDDANDPGPVPTKLLHVPGFVESVMDFCLSTAPYPNPVMAFCGAITLQGTLAGRKVRDDFDNRTNLFLLGLANSGAGKERPRRINQEILLNLDMANQVGDSFASAEGLEDRMLLTPTMLFQTDEIDSLLTSIRDGKDGRSDKIMQSLLKFYSSANGIYPMRVKAGSQPEFINQPCLSLFGTAVPKHFYEALSSKMLSNGFFARMLILEPGKRGTGQRSVIPPVPESILSVARWWSQFNPGTKTPAPQFKNTPIIVPTAPEALELLDGIRLQTETAYNGHEAKNDQMGMSIWARATEKVHRLALTYACSVNHLAMTITPEAVQWAWNLVEHQTKRMISMANLHSYESDFDAKQKKAIQAIKNRGGSISQDRLTKAMRTLSSREREEVITNLIQTRQIVTSSVSTPGRPRTMYQLPHLHGK